MKIIGIVGSRRRNSSVDYKLCLNTFLKYYKKGDEIVSGGCPKGGDLFAEVIAKELQIPIKIYYAQWDLLGLGAGFTRNTYIARDCDILLAVVAPDRTGGAEDTVRKAIKMNKTIILINNDKIEVINNRTEVNDILKEFKIDI